MNAPSTVVGDAPKPHSERSFLFDREGLRPRWRVLLFLAAMFMLWPQTERPVNWVVARGWIAGSGHDEWTALMHLAAFAAVLIPTLIAARLERLPLDSYGIPWRQAFRGMFWEGAAWGLAAISLQVCVLQATHCISVHLSGLGGRTSLAFAGRWGFTMLAVALFEECLKRGYLLTVAGRTLGFWPAAVVLASLFGLEKLLAPEYRTLIAFLSVVLYALLMCLTLKLTGSLWFAIGFHCGVEWCTVFIFGIRTPIIPHPEGTLLNVVFQGPAWITGGQSGLMASILMPLLIIALSLVLRVRFRQTQQLAKPSFSH